MNKNAIAAIFTVLTIPILCAGVFAQGIVIPEISLNDADVRGAAYLCLQERASAERYDLFSSPFDIPAYFSGNALAPPSYSAAHSIAGLPSNVRMITFSYMIGGSKPFSVAVYTMSGRRVGGDAPENAEYAGVYRFRSAQVDFGGKPKNAASGNEYASIRFPRGVYIAKARIQDKTSDAALALNAVRTPSWWSRLKDVY